MDLNTFGIFNDIFQSKINVLHLSKFLRSISWEPSVMIGWASQMDARETLYCHMFLQSKKKKERTLDFNRYKTPPTVLKSRFKKWKAGILSQKMLFPPCVVVNFFFDEEERRYAITRRQRKEHKKGRNSPAQVKTPRTRTPFVRSFPALFIHSSAMREERYKNRFVSTKEKESKRWRKELPPFHPLSSIEVYRW